MTTAERLDGAQDPCHALRMSKIGRNDSCPCGSGKKYKNCHLGQPLVSTDGEVIAPPEDRNTRIAKAVIPGLIAVLLLGGLGAMWKGSAGLGVGVAVGLFLGVGLMLMRNPPPPADNDGGSAINFGN